jgi:hypothetical protein
MGLAGSLGLKSLFSLASLIGKDIVANSITLTANAVAARFLSNLTGAAGVTHGMSASLGMGFNTTTGDTQFFNALTVGNPQWHIAGASGILTSNLNRAISTGGYGSFGQLVLPITDTSGTPGNATANTVTGKSAIAAGASSCVISNNLALAGCRILITPLARDATGLNPAVTARVAGTSFTVTTSANCTADLPFEWLVIL